MRFNSWILPSWCSALSFLQQRMEGLFPFNARTIADMRGRPLFCFFPHAHHLEVTIVSKQHQNNPLHVRRVATGRAKCHCSPLESHLLSGGPDGLDSCITWLQSKSVSSPSVLACSGNEGGLVFPCISHMFTSSMKSCQDNTSASLFEHLEVCHCCWHTRRSYSHQQ